MIQALPGNVKPSLHEAGYSLASARQTSQDIESVFGSVRRQKIRDGVRSPSRATEKLKGLLGNSQFLHVAILTRLRLVNILDLPNKRDRFFRALSVL